MTTTQKIFKILESLNECVVKIAWLGKNTEGVIHWGDDGVDEISINLPLVLAEILIRAYIGREQIKPKLADLEEPAEKIISCLSARELRTLGRAVQQRLKNLDFLKSEKMSKLTADIINFLTKIKITTKWLNKKTRGQLQAGILTINLELIVAEIFIHEWLHRTYPDANEEIIIKKTESKIKNLRKTEIKTIAEAVLQMTN